MLVPQPLCTFGVKTVEEQALMREGAVGVGGCDVVDVTAEAGLSKRSGHQRDIRYLFNSQSTSSSSSQT